MPDLKATDDQIVNFIRDYMAENGWGIYIVYKPVSESDFEEG